MSINPAIRAAKVAEALREAAKHVDDVEAMLLARTFALQRIGTLLGLPAGSDLLTECEPRLRELIANQRPSPRPSDDEGATQPLYDLAWEHGAQRHVSLGGDELGSLTFTVTAVQRIVQLRADRSKRIYIAGPMTGLPEYNFPAFNAKAAELRAQGWHVENPAEHGHIDGADWADYLRWDISRIATCGAIYLLPGWEQSKGARLEVHIGTVLGIRFYTAPGATFPESPAGSAHGAGHAPAQEQAAPAVPVATTDDPLEGHLQTIPGLGRKTQHDGGFVTLQFVDEAAAEAFMRDYASSVDVDEMPPIESPAPAEAPAVPVASGWSGWACQYHGKIPRLYGAREIAEVNHYPEQGDRMFLLVEAGAASQATPADDEIWRDIRATLQSCVDDGLNPELDEVDCKRLLALMDARRTGCQFTNELGNAIRITIEGPTSTSENVLTPMEVEKLRGALNAHAEASQGGGKDCTKEIEE